MPNEQPFTPGPWETSRDAVPPGHVQITVYAETGGRGTRVATVFETEANAQLIAAAPALYEACRTAADALRIIDEHHNREASNTRVMLEDALALVEVAQ